MKNHLKEMIKRWPSDKLNEESSNELNDELSERNYILDDKLNDKSSERNDILRVNQVMN